MGISNQNIGYLIADIKKETPKAYLVDVYMLEEPIWIPKSQITNLNLISQRKRDTGVTFHCPEWLIKEKGIE